MILPIKSDIGMCMCPCPLVSIKVTLTKVELLLYITYYHSSTDSTHVYTHTYPRTCMCDFFCDTKNNCYQNISSLSITWFERVSLVIWMCFLFFHHRFPCATLKAVYSKRMIPQDKIKQLFSLFCVLINSIQEPQWYIVKQNCKI